MLLGDAAERLGVGSTACGVDPHAPLVVTTVSHHWLSLSNFNELFPLSEIRVSDFVLYLLLTSPLIYSLYSVYCGTRRRDLLLSAGYFYINKLI